jgi:hypothetical protein
MQCHFANNYRCLEGNCSPHFQAISSYIKEPSISRQTQIFILTKKCLCFIFSICTTGCSPLNYNLLLIAEGRKYIWPYELSWHPLWIISWNISRLWADYFVKLRNCTQGDRALRLLVSIFSCQIICWLLYRGTRVTLHAVHYENIMQVRCWKTGFRGECSEVGWE